MLANLSWRHRILIAAGAIAAIAALVGFTRWKRERDFRPLFTGLAAEDAGAVIAKLRETGTEYRVGDGGTAVLVPSERVAELRLQLASAGLPRSGRIGFELFDKTNFGVTDFAEHINYRRAVEGELERSVMALAEVEQARVHVTFPKDSVFLESRQPAKASIMVKLRPGARLAPANVLAVCHLVSSAVEGLSPESVSVLDMNGNLLSRPRKPLSADGEQPSEAMLEFRQQIEKDLVSKINSTLDPVLGSDKFRAGVSVECDFSGGEQSEETFDPTRSVMTSSQKTEDISGTNLASGVPGTASNLPRPTSRPGSSGLGLTRRTENIAFQTSRVVRRTRLPQGTLRRISTAVLVDHTLRWEGSGAKARRIVEPPPPEKLKVIRDLVVAATGLVTERGDQLIVEALPFESTLAQEPPQPPPPAPSAPRLPSWLEQLQRNRVLLVAASAAAVGLVLLLGGAAWLLHRRRKKRARVAPGPAAVAGPAAVPQLEAGPGAPAVQQQLEARLAEQEALKQRLEAEALSSLKLPPVTSKKGEVLAKHLMEIAKKDPVQMAHILRTWLYDAEH